MRFSFEELEVWQRAIEFAEKVIRSSEQWNTPGRHYRLLEQLESAATSVAMNIAEGKGRYSKREFIQFLYIARGSLFETITLLIIVCRLSWIEDSELEGLRNEAIVIGKMLSNFASSLKRTL